MSRGRRSLRPIRGRLAFRKKGWRFHALGSYSSPLPADHFERPGVRIGHLFRSLYGQAFRTLAEGQFTAADQGDDTHAWHVVAAPGADRPAAVFRPAQGDGVISAAAGRETEIPAGIAAVAVVAGQAFFELPGDLLVVLPAGLGARGALAGFFPGTGGVDGLAADRQPVADGKQLPLRVRMEAPVGVRPDILQQVAVLGDDIAQLGDDLTRVLVLRLLHDAP